MREPFEIAKAYALALLSRRAYTEAGLYGKLVTRCDEETAAAAVARMAELGLLDDEDYGRRYLSDLIKLKGMSKRRALQELKRKGIAAELADRLTGEIEDAPQPLLARVIKRKYMRYLSDEKGRKKTVSALLRLGYSLGDILAVLRNLETDEDYYEDWEQIDE